MNLTYYELKEWFKNHQLKYYSKEFDLEFDVNKIDDLFYFVFDNFLYNDKYENELKKQNFKFDSNTVRNIINIYKNNNSKTKIFFKIGRASCRERVIILDDALTSKKKKCNIDKIQYDE